MNADQTHETPVSHETPVAWELDGIITAADGSRVDQQGRILCSAHRTDGEPCRGPAMRAQAVCVVHGGGSPQARAAADRRLVSLVDPSLDAIEHALRHGTPAERIRAAETVLDRVGITRAPVSVELSLAETKRALYERLTALTQRDSSEQPRALEASSSDPGSR